MFPPQAYDKVPVSVLPPTDQPGPCFSNNFSKTYSAKFQNNAPLYLISAKNGISNSSKSNIDPYDINVLVKIPPPGYSSSRLVDLSPLPSPRLHQVPVNPNGCIQSPFLVPPPGGPMPILNSPTSANQNLPFSYYQLVPPPSNHVFSPPPTCFSVPPPPIPSPHCNNRASSHRNNGEKRSKLCRSNSQSFHMNSMQPKHVPFHCEPCDRDFGSEEKYEQHVSEHVICGIDGCKFTGHLMIVDKHVSMQHRSGLFNRIVKGNSPEEIKKWIEERKKQYPTQVRIETKQAQKVAMAKRGERYSEPKNTFNNRRNPNGSKTFGNSRQNSFNRQTSRRKVNETDSKDELATKTDIRSRQRKQPEQRKDDDDDFAIRNLPPFRGTAYHLDAVDDDKPESTENIAPLFSADSAISKNYLFDTFDSDSDNVITNDRANSVLSKDEVDLVASSDNDDFCATVATCASSTFSRDDADSLKSCVDLDSSPVTNDGSHFTVSKNDVHSFEPHRNDENIVVTPISSDLRCFVSERQELSASVCDIADASNSNLTAPLSLSHGKCEELKTKADDFSNSENCVSMALSASPGKLIESKIDVCNVANSQNSFISAPLTASCRESARDAGSVGNSHSSSNIVLPSAAHQESETDFLDVVNFSNFKNVTPPSKSRQEFETDSCVVAGSLTSRGSTPLSAPLLKSESDIFRVDDSQNSFNFASPSTSLPESEIHLRSVDNSSICSPPSVTSGPHGECEQLEMEVCRVDHSRNSSTVSPTSSSSPSPARKKFKIDVRRDSNVLDPTPTSTSSNALALLRTYCSSDSEEGELSQDSDATVSEGIRWSSCRTTEAVNHDSVPSCESNETVTRDVGPPCCEKAEVISQNVRLPVGTSAQTISRNVDPSNDDSEPEECSSKACPPEVENVVANEKIASPGRSTDALAKGDAKRNRKRKRREGRDQSKEDDKAGEGKVDEVKKVFPDSLVQKRNKRPTLLEKLLAKEIKHERNVILQCVRYVVQNNYFEKGKS